MSGIDDENQQFFVVVNDEGQHSIWPDFKAILAGWRAGGLAGDLNRSARHPPMAAGENRLEVYNPFPRYLHAESAPRQTPKTDHQHATR